VADDLGSGAVPDYRAVPDTPCELLDSGPVARDVDRHGLDVPQHAQVAALIACGLAVAQALHRLDICLELRDAERLDAQVSGRRFAAADAEQRPAV